MALTTALAALVVGFLLIQWGRGARHRRGLTDAPTLDLDSRVLYSRQFGLAGRPDRLVRKDGMVIPEEWKSSLRVYDSHRAQLAVYFILVEQEYGVRPPHGFISLGKDKRVRIENTAELRAWVLDVAKNIRVSRRELNREIPVRQPAAKCRACGMRRACGQRKG